MDNLVSQTYLHNTKWNFLNNLAEVGTGINGSNYRTAREISFARQKLEQKREAALSKEQQFYADFRVANHIEWSKKYLIMDDKEDGSQTDESIYQIFFKIINSPQMVQILQGQGSASDADKTRKKFEEAAATQTDSLVQEFCNNVMQAVQNETEIEEAIANYFLEIGQRGKKSGGGREGQNKILEAFRVGTVNGIKENNTRAFTQKTSKAIKALMKQFRMSDPVPIAQRARSYFETQLTRYSNKIDINVIPSIGQEFYNALIKDAQSSSSAMINSNQSVVIGAVAETGQKISFELAMQFDSQNPDMINNFHIEAFGSQLVDRYSTLLKKNNQVQSKTDLKYNFTDEENKIFHTYNIQHKNSMADFYNNIGVLKAEEKFEDIMGSIKLHGTLSYDKYLAMAENTVGARYDPMTVELLSYLLVNLNVLNQLPAGEEKAYKGQGKSGGIPLSQTQNMIDSIFAENIDLFISDVLELDNVQYTTVDSMDFIIFKGRLLLPMSHMYEAIIQSLQIEEKQFYQPVHVTTTMGGFIGRYNTMKLEKAEAGWKAAPGELGAKPFNEKEYYIYYDGKKKYTDDGFIEAGASAGQAAKSLLTISGIHYNFRFAERTKRNLVSISTGI